MNVSTPAPEDRPLIFTDLDDTLFQTRRKIPADQHDGLVRAALPRDGDPDKISYMTVRQAGLIRWLCQSAEVIPVTARSADAFNRIDIGLDGWAVLANGAVILEPGGTPHQPWAERMAKTLAPARIALARLLDAGRAAADRQGLDMRSWIVSDSGLDIYVVFKLNAADRQDGHGLEALDFAAADIDLTGWVRHRNGNNLALIPPGTGKSMAVRYLLERLDPGRRRPAIAAGDSLSDLDFMGLADLALIPGNSQIADAYWPKTS